MNKLKPVAAAVGLGLALAVTSALANDVDPFGFEKEHFITSKTRAEVVAELQAAQARGELPVAGEIGVRFADAPSTKTRAQVVAETLEAARLGVLTYGEEGPPILTAEQAHQIEMAGLRAREAQDMAAKSEVRSGG